MKNPVTDQAGMLPEHAALVCKVDSNGLLTYANRDFAKVSGFSEPELLGHSHTLVQHPDMPPVLFKDLWDTVKASKPWTGIIKQRAKNGDSYWVKSNLVPLGQGDHGEGYLSVSIAASPDQIGIAEKLYQQVRAGKTTLGHTSPWARFNLLKHLSVWQKLALVMVTLMIPFVLQMTSYLGLQYRQVELTHKELRGIQYVQPLRQMMEHMAVHRGASVGYLAGKKQFEEKMRAEQQRVDEAFQSPVGTDARLQAELETAQDWNSLRQRWEALKTKVWGLTSQASFQEHTELIKSVHTLVEQVGDNSGLILDSELDSYYLMDALVKNLPDILERLGIVRAKTTGFISNQEHAEEKRAELRQLLSLAEVNLIRVAKDMDMALRYNPALAGPLEKPTQSFLEDARRIIQDIRQGVVESATISLDPVQTFDRITRIIGAGYGVYDATFPRFVGLLEERIQRLHAGIGLDLLLDALFVLLAVGLAAWIIRGITRPLAETIVAFRHLAAGDFHHPIPYDNGAHDEVALLLRELQKMQVKLGFDVMDTREKEAASTRIKQALDAVSTAATVSDADGLLIYLNGTAQRLFGDLTPAIRAHRPSFKVEGMLGASVAQIFVDPELVHQYSQRFTSERRFRTRIGEHTLDLVANPIYGSDGAYQGRITQWTDVTEQLAAAAAEAVRIEEDRRIAAENLRIRTALDNVSSSVMVTDPQQRIIYLNKSAHALFREAETGIRADLPQFDAGRLLGDSLQIFQQGKTQQGPWFGESSQAQQSELVLGGHSLRVITNPVIGSGGERLGMAVEWTDRTAEVAVEREIDAIVHAARAGDLSGRIVLADKKGFFLQLGEGINSLIGVVESVAQDIAAVMSRLADGDLTRPITADYAGTFGTVKEDVNRTLYTLSQTVSQLRGTADLIYTSAAEISRGNGSLSERTEQQASSLEETASSMEELTATVGNNASNTQTANQLATTAQRMAERGGMVVDKAVQAMDAIHTASDKIAEIIGVIDAIAFQTNLLALNASVEAARAGEQGRGFAVVATEVRNLASRSAQAARQIKELIRDSGEKVKTGAELVNESGYTLREIMGGVKKVSHIIAEIAAASAEQAAGIDQVNQAVTHMDGLTQQNAALAEQTSAASQSMAEKAQEMRELVGFFKAAARKPAPSQRTQVS